MILTRRKRKKYIMNHSVIFIVIILLFNLMGVSYARWSGMLTIDHVVHTGRMAPQFCKNNVTVRNEGLSVRFEDEYTMTVEGHVYKNEDICIVFNVENQGNVPAKFCEEDMELDEGLELEIDENNGMIEKDKLYQYKLVVDPEKWVNVCEFEQDLIFRQYNADDKRLFKLD